MAIGTSILKDDRQLDSVQLSAAQETVKAFPGQTIWMIYETVSRMNQVAFEGTELELVYAPPLGVSVTVPLPDNPVWHDLREAADKAVFQSLEWKLLRIVDFIDEGKGKLRLVTAA